MRPFTSTIPFDDALKIVLEAAEPIGRVEDVAIGEADGRVLADNILAAADVPPFERAAMDGYAVRSGDTSGASAASPRVLRRVGVIYGGDAPAQSVGRGECIEVATGAPLPAGADAVVMVEETTRDGDLVRMHAAATPRQHVGRRGADLAAGEVVVTAGHVLTPSRLGALAATGVGRVHVFAKPTVGVVPTGNELVEPGRALGPGQIYEINRFTIGAVVRRHGGIDRALPAVPDTIEALEAALDRVHGCDLIVLSGGSSVGERDLIIDVLRARGEVVFHGIAVKPGKPTAFGRIGRVPVLGLPGYPTSCLSNALILLAPMLRKMARLPPWRPPTVDCPLARRVASVAGRHQFYTVRIVSGQAEPAFKASGDITSMAHADGYIEIPTEVTAVEAGETVRVTLFQ